MDTQVLKVCIIVGFAAALGAPLRGQTAGAPGADAATAPSAAPADDSNLPEALKERLERIHEAELEMPARPRASATPAPEAVETPAATPEAAEAQEPSATPLAVSAPTPPLDEAEQRAVLALTTGYWYPEGATSKRNLHVDVFKPDGTLHAGTLFPNGDFNERPSFGGTWTITDAGIQVTLNVTKADRVGIVSMSLPVNPAGTQATMSNGQTAIFRQGTGIRKMKGRDGQ